MTTPPNLLPDAFAGAAVAYARYRPPYPEALLSDLLSRVASHGGLLDLACGPGRGALDLAGAFDTGWAVDLEPERVEIGQQEGARRGVSKVTRVVGAGEEMAAPAGAFAPDT